MNTTCVHSCKGLCTALEVAEHREQEAIREYRKFAGGCDYPDVLYIDVVEDLVRMSRGRRPRWIANKGVVPKWNLGE